MYRLVSQSLLLLLLHGRPASAGFFWVFLGNVLGFFSGVYLSSSQKEDYYQAALLCVYIERREASPLCRIAFRVMMDGALFPSGCSRPLTNFST